MDPATIESGAEIDRLIAERVMGWRFFDTALGRLYEIVTPGDPPLVRVRGPEDWSPSTNIADAWEVVERMRERWTVQVRSDDDVWCVTFRTAIVHHAKAETAPLAICRAALAAVAR